MPKMIWKFPLERQAANVVSLPSGAELLTVQLQNGRPTLWAVVDPTNGTVGRVVHRVLTGEHRPAAAVKYLGTTQDNFIPFSSFVEHWFSDF